MRSLWRQRFGATIGLLLAALALNACGRGAATAPSAKPTSLAAATAPLAPSAAPADVEIVAHDGGVLARIDRGYDQHRLVAGAGDALFALNWLHDTATRYSLRRSARVWHVELPDQQPWDATFVPGG